MNAWMSRRNCTVCAALAWALKAFSFSNTSMSWKWLVVGVQLIILNTTTQGSLRLSCTESFSTGTAWSVKVGMMSRWVTTTTPLARTLEPGPSATADPIVRPANRVARNAPRSIDMVALLLPEDRDIVGRPRSLEQEAVALVER